jgi:esterase
MQLNFQTTGTGQPLLIVHGLFGSRDNWAGINRRLARFCQAFSLDFRDHGGSPDGIYGHEGRADSSLG